jgi:hypothetical protein
MSVELSLGGGKRSFALGEPQIKELERLTGTGIASICRRVFHGEFFLADLTETIRLGMIGAGTDPKEATATMAAYVAGRPVSEFLPVALGILESVWFGPKPAKTRKPKP